LHVERFVYNSVLDVNSRLVRDRYGAVG